MFYFNVSAFVGEDGKLEEGNYDDNDVVRTIAIAQKFDVVTVLLYEKRNATKLQFSLTGKSKAGDHMSVSRLESFPLVDVRTPRNVILNII